MTPKKESYRLNEIERIHWTSSEREGDAFIVHAVPIDMVKVNSLTDRTNYIGSHTLCGIDISSIGIWIDKPPVVIDCEICLANIDFSVEK